MRKCAGMDQQNWKFDDIVEIPCDNCSTMIEIWKNDVFVFCPECTARIVNPRLGDICLRWCSSAIDCLGNRDIETWKKSMGISD